MDICDIGPAGAARILADVGDVARFPDRNHFASWTGTAPIDASSGEHVRQRLSRAGNASIPAVTSLTHVLITRAPVERAASALGEAVPVGRLGDWTVAAMNLGDAVGVAASVKGKMYPLMWSAGWRRPSNPLMDRRARIAWEEGAKTLAKRAGQPKVGKALGAVRNPGDGLRESLDRCVTEAMQLLGIPAELRGVHSADLGPLTDVVRR